MSSGHHHTDASPGLNSQALDRLLADRAVRECLYRYRPIDRNFDIPYLAGYSQDGSTIFIDRHLPETLELEFDGRKREVNPDEYLRRHEGMEKSLIDTLGYGYAAAHAAATAWERRGVLERLGPGWWVPYSEALAPWIKSDQLEKLVKVPSNLDMTPYLAEPVDKALVARIQAAQGLERAHSKAEVGYGDDHGKPRYHCGPVKEWPGGDCEHFESPRSCAIVRGAISPRGKCRLWEAKE